MGYFLTSQPENAVPPKSRAMPKTHTPGSRLEKRGARFYNPEMGRWVSRDPLGDESFRLFWTARISLRELQEQSQSATLYEFSGNMAICCYDSHGLFWKEAGEWIWKLGKWYWNKHVRPSPYPNPDPISPPGIPDPWFDSPPVGDDIRIYCKLFGSKRHDQQCPRALECNYRCYIPGPGIKQWWPETIFMDIHGPCKLEFERWLHTKE